MAEMGTVRMWCALPFMLVALIVAAIGRALVSIGRGVRGLALSVRG